VVLEWATFSEAADQAGISRLYGGIHFDDGDINGRQLGKEVGESVWSTTQSLISPIAHIGTSFDLGSQLTDIKNPELPPEKVPEPGSIFGLFLLGVLSIPSLLMRISQ
jgi:hypothetical protein